MINKAILGSIPLGIVFMLFWYRPEILLFILIAATLMILSWGIGDLIQDILEDRKSDEL